MGGLDSGGVEYTRFSEASDDARSRNEVLVSNDSFDAIIVAGAEIG
jgi:hypothetical protein